MLSIETVVELLIENAAPARCGGGQILKPRRHGGNSRGVTGPRRPQTTQKASAMVKLHPVESCIAKEAEVGLNKPCLDAVREPAEVSLGSPSVSPCLRGSLKRSEVEQLLKNQPVEVNREQRSQVQ